MKEERSASRATGEGKAPTVSVIVPVHNVEKYLRQCIDSILAQTFTDFELLLIDDGSPDTSGAICDEYASRDPRVRVFHKENGGPSAARNLGLDHAQGEWICFVDADDYVDPDHLQNYMSAPDADIIYQGYKMFDNDGVIIRERRLIEYETTERNECMRKICELLNDKSVFNSPWSKIYKNTIVQQHNIRFKEDIICGEDKIFNLEYLRHISSLFLATGRTYNYRVNNESISRQGYRDVDELQRNIAYTIKIMEDAHFTTELDKALNAYCTDVYCLMGRMLYYPGKLITSKESRIERIKMIISRNRIYPTRQSRMFCVGSAEFIDFCHLIQYRWKMLKSKI